LLGHVPKNGLAAVPSAISAIKADRTRRRRPSPTPALRTRQPRKIPIECRNVPPSGTHNISLDDTAGKVAATAEHPRPGSRWDTIGLHVGAGDDNAVNCIGNFGGMMIGSRQRPWPRYIETG
jgi:hypothetical protein